MAEKEYFMRYKIALVISLVSTVLSVIGWKLTLSGGDGGTLIGIGIATAIVAYCFAGLGQAVRMGVGIAKVGLITVFFPANIFVFLMLIPVTIVATLFVPVIPVLRAYRQYGRA